MKRLLFYIGSITFAIVIAFTSIGLVHYIDNENSKQTIDVSSSSSSELFNLQQEINNLFLKKDEFLREKEDLLSELSVAQGSSQTYVQAIADLEDEIETLYVQKLEYESDKQDIEDLLDELDETDEEQAGQIATLQGQIVTINSSISSIESQISSLQTQIASLQTSNSSILTQIADLTTRISAVETSISTIESDISSIENDITAIYTRLNALDKNIICAGNNTYKQVTNTSETEVPLVEYNKVGNKLSLSSNKVVVGNNVSKVLISGTVSFDSATSGTYYFTIKINGTDKSYNRFISNVQQFTMILTPALFNVSSGDKISISVHGPNNYYINSNSGSTVLRTYMTVEVVE